METYQAVLAKISKLQEKADQLRRAEIKDVVQRIREAIQHYALTAADLGFTDAGTPKKRGRKPGAPTTSKAPKAGASKGAPKYRDPQTGKTWTGRGKPPNWIVGAASRDAFLIDAVAAAAPPAAPKARRASATAKLPKTGRTAGSRKARKGSAANAASAPAAEGAAS